MSPCIFHSFLSQSHAALRDLHSFPTRRSSDLCTPWPSPAKNNAPSLNTGRYSVVPGRSSLLSMLPPKLRGTGDPQRPDRKSTRLNSSHVAISYAVFCLKKKNKNKHIPDRCNDT